MVAIFDVGLIILLLTLTSRVIQGISDYYIDDAWLEKLNGDFMDLDNTNVEVVWTNSTMSGLGINITLIKDMPTRTTGHFNVFQRTNGDYKTHSGISVNLPWCQIIKDRVMMASLIEALNMTACPPRIGTYSVAEWHPSTEKMPDYLPGTQYKVDFAIKDRKTFLLQLVVLISLY